MNVTRKICVVVGTRPNFVKVTQFKAVARKRFSALEVEIVHTGQHYDTAMSGVFFDQFGLRPDRFLNVAPGHPAKQIAGIIVALTDHFEAETPDLVIVVGDVNSTLAAAVAANKCGLPVAHLESGLRSGDRTMPEEHNRLVADALADLHFVTEESGLHNLRGEGKSERGIAFVGNTMIDTLAAFSHEIDASDVLDVYGLRAGEYALATIHRPSNVDTAEGLETTLSVLGMTAEKLPVVFAAHPRTLARMEALGLRGAFDDVRGLKMIPAQGYFDFQKLVRESRFVLTDSGGIQEETTYLGKPCLTLRPNTERPITVTRGTNTLLEFDLAAIEPVIDSILEGTYKKGRVPELWDGRATERVLQRVEEFFEPGR